MNNCHTTNKFKFVGEIRVKLFQRQYRYLIKMSFDLIALNYFVASHNLKVDDSTIHKIMEKGLCTS